MSTRQIAMIGLLQAQNCSNFPASWRHPRSVTDFLSPEYYQRVARTLEEGKFHLAFFDDRLAMPDRFGDDFRESVRAGVRVVKMDLPGARRRLPKPRRRGALPRGGTFCYR